MIDPQRLKPADLTRLLNSTPLATVIDARQLYSHRMRAGYQIGTDKSINLFRYVAWLIEARMFANAPAPSAGSGQAKATGYEGMKESAAARNRELSLSGRDIGPLPKVEKPHRKRKAKKSFKCFCEIYFPQTFSLAWSPDHLKVIARIEKAVLKGGLFAMAMPRGTGKTSLVECAGLWAVLYGHRNFGCLIGASEVHAIEMLDSIKMELDGNDLLMADFPEVCHPIRSLEGIANRCSGQLYKGERTRIGWTNTEIILPTMPRSKASGAIIKVAGITGRIRGLKFKRSDGKTVRPDLAILDDPQTDESARSLSQCANRERILAGAVLGLAGPRKKIAGVMPCTVIRPGDMADKILDRDVHPEWNGERTKMVNKFPKNTDLWEKYGEVRGESLRKHGDLRAATAFYKANRKALDEGSEIAWPERFNHDEISALQHAMNLRLRDEAAFFAEYQNEPLPEVGLEDDAMLSADQIARKLNGHRRGGIPIGAQHLTGFIDVQKKLLYWMVVAWDEAFTGHVVDYGTYPDQRRRYFTLRDATKTLQRAEQGVGLEAAIYSGLEMLTDDLFAREWRREDGAGMKIERCLIDAGWGQSTNTVYLLCGQSQHAALLMPSHGRYVGASSRPMADYTKKPGELVGLNWRVPLVAGKRQARHVLFDTNYWKSFIHARFAVKMGDKGCLSLFGRKPDVHRMLSEHLTAEYSVRTEGRGRTVDEWKQRPNTPENHWLDCLVGCAVAGSMLGVSLPSADHVVARVKRKRIKLSTLQGSRR